MSSRMRNILAEVGLSGTDEDLAAQIERALQNEAAPQPDADATARLRDLLIARLRCRETQSERFRQALLATRAEAQLHWPAALRSVNSVLTLARPQVRLLGKGFWIASAVVMLLGALVTPGDFGMPLSPLFLLAPLLAVVSVVYAFRSYSYGVVEWEQACPVTPAELVLARLFLVVFYDIALSTMASAILYARGGGDSLALIILAWLAPLLAAAGVTLLAAVRHGVAAASLTGAALWLAIALFSDGGAALVRPGVAEGIGLVVLTLAGLGSMTVAVLCGPERGARRAG